MAEQAGYKAYVQLCGASTSITDEALTNVTGDIWEATATRDIWNPEVAWTVETSEDGGSNWDTLGTAEYTLRYLLGRVEIDGYTSGSGNTANITDVRVDGAYFPKYKLTYARGVDHELMANLLDASHFEDEGERRIQGRLDVSASVESLDFGELPLDGSGGSESSILDMVLAATRTVLTIVPTGTASDFELRSWVKIEMESSSIPGGDIQQATLEMAGDLPRADDSGQPAKTARYK